MSASIAVYFREAEHAAGFVLGHGEGFFAVAGVVGAGEDDAWEDDDGTIIHKDKVLTSCLVDRHQGNLWFQLLHRKAAKERSLMQSCDNLLLKLHLPGLRLRAPQSAGNRYFFARCFNAQLTTLTENLLKSVQKLSPVSQQRQQNHSKKRVYQVCVLLHSRQFHMVSVNAWCFLI